MMYNYLVTGQLPDKYVVTGNPVGPNHFYAARSEEAFQNNVDAVAGKGELPWTPTGTSQ